MMRSVLAGLLAAVLVLPLAASADQAGVVKKASIDVYAEPKFDAKKVSTLKRDAKVTIAGQQGLWFQLQLKGGQTGFVRVNDIRVTQAVTADGGAPTPGLTAGQAGAGRATETAGVRGIDETELRVAAYNQAELDMMTGYRVADTQATAHAATQGWEPTKVAYENELKPKKSQPAKSSGGGGGGALSAARGLLGSFGGSSVSNNINKVDSASSTAQRLKPKSEEQQSAEELALGPQIAGRALGARKLWDDATAQQRVNTIGRWMASQTTRPDLPWSFGIIDTDEVSAFAAPGGYVLVTRGLYELLTSDSELAAVLGHEIAHCVQRDHYKVIREQEMASTTKDIGMAEVRQEAASSEVAQTQAGSAALNFALAYVEKHGATILLTSLDRAAEYQADEAAEIYVARAGMNPMAFYSVLQKMAALGSQSPKLASLYRTHPALDDRMDRIDERDYDALKPYTKRE
jgi:Zn-dependent protease with chaperone function